MMFSVSPNSPFRLQSSGRQMEREREKKERKKRELKYRDGGSIIPQHLLRLAL